MRARTDVSAHNCDRVCDHAKSGQRLEIQPQLDRTRFLANGTLALLSHYFNSRDGDGMEEALDSAADTRGSFPAWLRSLFLNPFLRNVPLQNASFSKFHKTSNALLGYTCLGKVSAFHKYSTYT